MAERSEVGGVVKVLLRMEELYNEFLLLRFDNPSVTARRDTSLCTREALVGAKL